MSGAAVEASGSDSGAAKRSSGWTVRVSLYLLGAACLLLAIRFIAGQIAPPTGPTYAVGMCISGHVSPTDNVAPSVAVVPCDRPHQYIVVKIIDPTVTQSHEICEPPYAGALEFSRPLTADTVAPIDACLAPAP